jgi:hypothetical protein
MKMEANIYEDCTPKTVLQALLMAKDIIKIVEANPTVDVIFKLTESDVADIDPNYCVAGSAAVTLIIKSLKMKHDNLTRYLNRDLSDDLGIILSKIGMKNPTREGIEDLPQVKASFEANDTDVFFLNATQHHRVNVDNVDIVHLSIKDVPTLLMNFDLPCCRAAWVEPEHYWISAHCLASLFTEKYYLPQYMKNINKFADVARPHISKLSGLKMTYELEYRIHNRLSFRIEKYTRRGFTVEYIETDHITPWITNVFFYSQC